MKKYSKETFKSLDFQVKMNGLFNFTGQIESP